MFGSSNPFGQSSNSPFGNTSLFGQTSTVNNNPFTPKPFGTSPFGAQSGGSIFGGTSTGVFGATQSSSPIASTPSFGASSTPAFGSSAFGSSSTPAFGSGSSAFGGSSMFGQKPSFGVFGSTASQASPFGSTFQQSQPAFGSNVFGSSSPFGASSQPSFGATSAPAFGVTSSPAFGATSTPAFGATSAPAFGAASTPSFGATSTPAFGSTATPTFGTTASAFGSSNSPAFGTSGATAFGASGTSVFGSSASPAFGTSSSPAFGSSSSTFGASSTPSFSFGSSLAFGQSASTFGSSPFGSSPSPFGSQSSPFGSQSTTFGNVGFGPSAFGGQPGGSRVAPYAPTAEAEGGTTGTQPAGKLESISAMPVYKDKSHEELRWEDYQRGDKGGANPNGQSASGISFGTSLQSNPFSTSSTFVHTAGSPFSSATNSNPFASKPIGSTGFGTSSAPAFSSPFGASLSSPFSTSTPSTASTLFGPATTSAFVASSSPSLFGSSTTPAFGTSSSPSIFGSTSAPGTSPAFGSGLNFGNTQSSGLFQSAAPAIGQATSAFGSTMPSFGQNPTSSFGQPNLFGTPSTGFGGNLFTSNSTPSLFNTSNPVPFGQTTSLLSTSFPAPAQTSGTFAFGNFSQSQPVSNNIGTGSVLVQGAFGQSASAQNNMVAQPTPMISPFGTLPAMPQMSIGRSGSAPSIQYGISTMPIPDKPAPVRVSTLVTTRNFPQRRIRLTPRNYHSRSDSPKIPFFSDEDGPSTPKADALFIPRENPRALVIRPLDQWPSRVSAEKQPQMGGVQIHENGNSSEDRPAASLNGVGAHVHNDYDSEALGEGGISEQYTKYKEKSNGIHHEENDQKGESYIRFSGQRAGEAAIVYEHGADIEALMPKLRHADYYTEPRIQELAAKERAEPGCCRRVKDFVVGRHGYGSIKFMGETDVRRLDLESLVQFNSKEVIVYMDESKKPPIGQGLNKPAEVTLLNIKCFNKRTGQQYTDGPKVEKYKEMLMKKAQDQGAEFVSYDPVKGEWKFRVNHFSQYGLVNDSAEDVDYALNQ